MNRPSVTGAALMLVLAVCALPLSAQQLHTNTRWKNCAMVLDPSLTQAAWHQFISEMALVTYFRPLTSAQPLGRRQFEVGLLNWGTRIDDKDAAWNDTFSHPDSTHWLMEGNSLNIPGVMARAGITDRLDFGAYVTKAVDANYGLVGAQVQYNLMNDPARHLALSGRVSAVRLFGPEDLRASTYGLDLIVSKEYGRFAPYVGLTGYLARGHETTAKVALKDENVLGAQGTVGVAAKLSILRLGAEYDLARKSGFSMKVAFGI